MHVQNLYDKDSFIQFLEKPISQQLEFIKKNPSKKNNIETLAKEYLQSSKLQDREHGDLKLKAWLLLSKKESKVISLNSILINQTFVHELLQNVFNAGEFWRLKQLNAFGVRLDRWEIDSLLLDACYKGDLKAVKALLNVNANINGSDADDGLTPLHLALRAENIELAEFLIRNGGDLMQRDTEQKTPLHYLCENGKNKEALHLFQIYSNLPPLQAIEQTSSLGLTFIAKHLIDHLDLNQKMNDRKDSLDFGGQLIHTIVVSDHPNVEVLKYLKHKGADFEAVRDEKTPLQLAMSKSPINEELIHFLLDIGTKFDFGNGKYALNQALRSVPINLEIVERLIDLGADVNQRDSTDHTPLELAILRSSRELTELLIDNGARLDTKDSNGDSPLHIAANNPNTKIIELLIACGADIDATNDIGESCAWLIKFQAPRLPIASRIQRTDAFTEFELRKLLVNNYNLNAKLSEKGKTFKLAKGGRGRFGQAKIVELVKELKTQSADSTILDDACEAIEKGTKKATGGPEKISRQFNKGRTLIFSSGWSEHSVQVIFIGSYMLVTNRGEGRKKPSVQVYKIDRSQPLTQSAIKKLQKNNDPFEQGAKFIYEELPNSLGYQPGQNDLISQVMMEKCQQSDQKMSNCWWVSSKSGVLGLLTIQALIKESSKPYESEKKREEAYRQIVDSTQEIYKYFSEFTMLNLLKKYVERPPDQAERDHQLVKLAVDKYRSKNIRRVMEPAGFLNQTYEFFAGIVKKETKKILPPLYTRKEVEEWLDTYKRHFKLDSNFKPK